MDKENEEDVSNILTQLDLLPYADRHPVSLSGGQKQRVPIASALLTNEEILIFDDMFSQAKAILLVVSTQKNWLRGF